MCTNSAKNLTSIDDIDRTIIEEIFERARFFMGISEPRPRLPKGSSELLRGKVLASIFTQPSIRTRTGFQSAFLKLGGSIIDTPDIELSIANRTSSERIDDIVSYLTTYIDAVVLRTGENSIANIFLENARCPIINAGWANIEHPTTAIAHAYSIFSSTGKLSEHKVLMIANYQSRTFNSLVKLFQIFGTTDISIFSKEKPEICWKSNPAIEFFDAERNSVREIYDPDTTIVVVDESERRKCSRSFVTQAQLDLKFYQSDQKLEKLIHLKPVVELLSDDLKQVLNNDFINQSAISMHIKSAIFSWILEDVQ